LAVLEGIPAATEVSILNVLLPLLFLSRLATLLLGSEDVRYCPWQRLLESAQPLDVLIQRGVGLEGIHSVQLVFSPKVAVFPTMDIVLSQLFFYV